MYNFLDGEQMVSSELTNLCQWLMCSLEQEASEKRACKTDLVA